MSLRMFMNNFYNVCYFDYTDGVRRGKVWSVNKVNHKSRMTVLILTDRPKSVRNR